MRGSSSTRRIFSAMVCLFLSHRAPATQNDSLRTSTIAGGCLSAYPGSAAGLSLCFSLCRLLLLLKTAPNRFALAQPKAIQIIQIHLDVMIEGGQITRARSEEHTSE